jgi:hypothetical protein
MSPPRRAPANAARPRTKGDRLPTPTGLAAQAKGRQWRKVTVDVRGRPLERLVHVRDVLWYAVNKTDLVHLVVVRDPAGVEPDDFFITTDRTATGAQTTSRYAGRWSIEVCFRDVKQHLGGQDPQSWKRQGPERAAALSLWLLAMTWCWYLHTHPMGEPGSPDPGTGPRPPPASWTPSPHYAEPCGPNELQPCQAPPARTLKSPKPCSTHSPTQHRRQPTVRKSTHCVPRRIRRGDGGPDRRPVRQEVGPPLRVLQPTG